MIHNYRVPTTVFDDMIAGQRQDLQATPIPDFAALRDYCYRVASVVGEMNYAQRRSVELFLGLDERR